MQLENRTASAPDDIVASAPYGGATAPLEPMVQPVARSKRSRFGVPNWIRLLLGNRFALAGCIMLTIIVLAALFAPLITSQDPSGMGNNDPSMSPSPSNWFGTNHQGEDIFAQVIYGARLSLFIGASVGVLGVAIGAFVGMLAGYIGGWIDETLGVIMNIFLVIPSLPLLVVASAYLPTKSGLGMILILTLTGWAWGARVLRAQTYSLKNRDFVQAAYVSGESTPRIVFFEILPNMVSLLASSFIFTFIAAVLNEAALEFLGFGDSNIISWGTILYWAQTTSTLMTGEWWCFLFPGLAISLSITSLVFINYGIDAISNPRLRGIKIAKQYRKKASAQVSAVSQRTR
jgi:peptide/nickel transport system permease protein